MRLWDEGAGSDASIIERGWLESSFEFYPFPALNSIQWDVMKAGGSPRPKNTEQVVTEGLPCGGRPSP